MELEHCTATRRAALGKIQRRSPRLWCHARRSVNAALRAHDHCRQAQAPVPNEAREAHTCSVQSAQHDTKAEYSASATPANSTADVSVRWCATASFAGEITNVSRHQPNLGVRGRVFEPHERRDAFLDPLHQIRCECSASGLGQVVPVPPIKTQTRRVYLCVCFSGEGGREGGGGGGKN